MKRQLKAQVDTSVDTSGDESVNQIKREIGVRIKQAREALSLTQDALAALADAKSKSGLQDNEAGKTMPGGQMISALVRAGINANWLLTGEGPMLLKDIKAGGAVYHVDEPETWLNPAKQAPMKINRGALAALLRGAIAITAQGMSVEKAADMAAEMYERALLSGEITPDGVGDGSLGNAA